MWDWSNFLLWCLQKETSIWNPRDCGLVTDWSSREDVDLNPLKSWWERKHLSTREHISTRCRRSLNVRLFGFSFFTFFVFSTVIPFVPPLPGDGDQGEWCRFLFSFHNWWRGSFVPIQSTVRLKLIWAECWSSLKRPVVRHGGWVSCDLTFTCL